MRARALRLRLLATGVVVASATLSLAAAAPAQADPAQRLEARVAADGTWRITGELVVADPANPPAASTGRIELWRGGAAVPGATATGASDPSGFVTLIQDRTGRGGLDPSAGLQPGDVIEYFNPATATQPAASATYAGQPSLGGDACTGATSFTVTASGAQSVTAGAYDPAPGASTTDDGTTAAAGSDTYAVTLATPLTAGLVAWSESVAPVAAGTVSFVTRSERPVGPCTAPPPAGHPSTGTPGTSLGAGTPGFPPPTGSPAPPADNKPPVLTLGSPPRLSRGAIPAKIVLRAGCGKPCALMATLVVPSSFARRLHLSGARIGQGVSLSTAYTALPAGAGLLVVPLPSALRRALSRPAARGLSVSISVVAVDRAGHRVLGTLHLILR